MAKSLIRKLSEYKTLYRDTTNGLAWIEDTSAGCCISIHANIDASGSVRGMKNLGYWKKNARTIRSHGYIYNVDSLVVNNNNKAEMLLAETECKCIACCERREKEA